MLIAANSNSPAGIITIAFLAIGAGSLLVLTPWGRKRVLPLVALLLGLVVLIGSIWDLIRGGGISVVFLMGALVGTLLTIGGFGAIGGGVELPEVEGVEPTIEPHAPRHLPDDVQPPTQP